MDSEQKPQPVHADGASQAADESAAFWEPVLAATPRVYVTHTVMALNLLVFVAMVIRGVGIINPDTEQLMNWGADFWPLTTRGQWWRLVSNTFVHAGIIHLAMNMWALSSAGTLVERLYGNRFYGIIYLFSGVTGSLASTAWNHDVVSVGASGAVFGVYGALLAYLVIQRGSVHVASMRPLRNSTLAFVAYNIIWGFSQPGIDNSAHIGGLLGGIVLGLVLARPLEMERRGAQAFGRLAAGAVVILAVVGGGIGLMPRCSYDLHQEKAFRDVYSQFIMEDRTTRSIWGELAAEAKEETIDPDEFARQLEEQILGRWETMARKLSGLTMETSSPSRPLYDLMVRYAELRRRATIEAVRGLRAVDATYAAMCHRDFEALEAEAAKLWPVMQKAGETAVFRKHGL